MEALLVAQCQKPFLLLLEVEVLCCQCSRLSLQILFTGIFSLPFNDFASNYTKYFNHKNFTTSAIDSNGAVCCLSLLHELVICFMIT